jgi:hypothetical protein
MGPEPQHFAGRLVAGMSDALVYADAEGAIRLWNNGGGAGLLARPHHSRDPASAIPCGRVYNGMPHRAVARLSLSPAT